jgi:putative transcriptional regulator
VEFEWDPAKSEATYRIRGLDFAYASRVFSGDRIETIDTRTDYGEIRIEAIGQVGPDVLTVIYTSWLGAADHLRAPSEQEGASTVALTRMTLAQIMAAGGGKVDRARLDATTEDDIRRHMIEDGEDPDAEPPNFERVVLPQDVRKKLGMTQTRFAELLGVPVGTLRNWEQNRFVLEPAARTLLKLIDREPEAALRALRGPRVA